jgi:signal transduction histidine kinase
LDTVDSSVYGLKNPHSIRWRLPLSYAGIALLAAVALGGLLLLTLRARYSDLERRYLDLSARSVARSAEQLYRDRASLPDDVFQSSATIYSFLVNARVRLLDADRQLIADSGVEMDQSFVSVDVRRPELIAGELPPGGVMAGGAGARFETFLSVQGAWPDVSAPLESAGGPRYPVRLPPESVDRMLTGIISTDRRTGLSVTVPLYADDGGLMGYLELSDSPAFGSEIIQDVAEKAVLAGVIAVLLAAAAGWVASRQISHPVLSLAETTRRMADGDLSVRVTMERRDEFGLLARTFNAMAERVETTVIALKRFVADAAHEINTPLTALRTNLELAAAGECPDDFRADMARAQVELERLETLTQGLLTLSRLEARSAERARSDVDLTALVRQVHERHASRAEQAGIALALDALADPVMIRADERQIGRALDNLLDNALKFTPPGGTVTLELACAPDSARLRVADTGIGIPADDLPRLFSRFHRGRNAAAYPGNGLGLVITKAIVEDHGGHIAVESGGGTRVTIRLPREGGEGRHV